MARGRFDWTEEKFKRFVKEGRGQGEGCNYKPWLTVRDVPSMGRSTRLYGWKTQRGHHFLSDGETNFFFLLDWANDVLDIREQFPLNLGSTLAIADNKKIKHPIDQKRNISIVQTTDFLITVKSQGKIKYVAKTVKRMSELQKSRVMQKFEIEREYWNQLGVDWGIVTELDLPTELCSNIKWIHSAYWLEEFKDVPIHTLRNLLPILLQRIGNGGCTSIQAIVSVLDKEHHVETGTFLFLLKHLIARKIIQTDLSVKITTRKPAGDFTINESI